jgi:hypothetical protein
MESASQAVKTDPRSGVQASQETSGVGYTEIHVKGKKVSVPSAKIDGKTVLTSGGWLKMATLQDEELLESEPVPNPDSFISQLKETGLKADVFTFAQKLPDVTPKHSYQMEWDNLAIIPITTFSEWWDKRVEPSVRRAVRKAAKSGVTVRTAEFDDAYVQGIVGINNEAPVRQGRAFWHFQKPFEAVKLENSTYPGRNVYIGAFFEDQLIGYSRLIYAGNLASVVQVLSMMKHSDKRPTNALIAKAVEICEQAGISYLMYCNYTYNDPKSSLTEFKRRSGFEQVLIPRYYVPLTLKGKLALKLGMHRDLKQRIPKPVISQLLRMRSRWYAYRSKSGKEKESE